MGQASKAVEYLTIAIDLAQKDALHTEPATLADLYLARLQCFQELGLTEHAKLDYQKVLQADPNFIRRQMANSK
jgi:tetratricopeptide (TPR) repeat protein